MLEHNFKCKLDCRGFSSDRKTIFSIDFEESIKPSQNRLSESIDK